VPAGRPEDCLNCLLWPTSWLREVREPSMPRMINAALAAALWGGLLSVTAEADTGRFSMVAGVEADDMLKLRAGPGVGYRIIVGLPNGTVLRVYDCQQTGSTRWCKVAMKQARGLTGYVNATYLQEM
jgi:uncharacterized protein YraI